MVLFSSVPLLTDETEGFSEQLRGGSSHDARISLRNGGTGLADANNTITQGQSVLGQLKSGFRYLDIRPVIGNGGKWYSGHYGNGAGWQGWNGQSLADIIADINSFTNEYKELIIVNLSHGYNTDADYRDLTAKEWKTCFQIFGSINKPYMSASAPEDLSKLTVNSWIQDNAALLMISKFTDGTDKGVYNSSRLAIYDNYSDNASPAYVANDQLNKMATWRSTKQGENKKLFLLSWTGTPGLKEILTGTSIRDIAASLYPMLFQRVLPKITQNAIPNIILIDGVPESNDIASLSMAINSYLWYKGW
ncbi:hypothetical protein MBLNU459_g0261t1 [Dothideomycetes sp. NU459]